MKNPYTVVTPKVSIDVVRGQYKTLEEAQREVDRQQKRGGVAIISKRYKQLV